MLLAGGEGRRLGAAKPALRLGGDTLLTRNLAILRELFPRVGVSLRPGQQLGADVTDLVGVELLPDILPGSPLGGIVTALDRYREPVFILACDMALTDPGAIREVVDAFGEAAVDVAVPVVDGNYEPLHAVYGPACLAPMRRLLERGRLRVVAFFPDVRVLTVPFPTARPFFNINKPEDYEEALRLQVAGGARQAPRDMTTAVEAAMPVVTADGSPALVAVVGKSDSGKTTFIEGLLPELRARGLHVGTVKHDVHGFDIDTPGKDSWRHAQAGAEAYAIAGPDKLAFITRLERPLGLAELARRYFAGVDLVVAEGFKREAPHRIEIFRTGAGHTTPLCAPDESLALVTDAALEHPHRFALDDAAGVAGLIVERLAELRRY